MVKGVDVLGDGIGVDVHQQLHSAHFGHVVSKKVHLLKRGDPMQKLEVVSPCVIASLSVPSKLQASASDTERRLALAMW